MRLCASHWLKAIYCLSFYARFVMREKHVERCGIEEGSGKTATRAVSEPLLGRRYNHFYLMATDETDSRVTWARALPARRPGVQSLRELSRDPREVRRTEDGDEETAE